MSKFKQDLDRTIVEKIVAVYADAWTTQDPKKIISIFAPDGSYHEYVLRKSFIGHAEIKKYWEDRIGKEESDIHFKLLNIYIDGNTAIVEWEADFLNNNVQKRMHIREVAILEIVDEKIKSLREYWHSESL